LSCFFLEHARTFSKHSHWNVCDWFLPKGNIDNLGDKRTRYSIIFVRRRYDDVYVKHTVRSQKVSCRCRLNQYELLISAGNFSIMIEPQAVSCGWLWSLTSSFLMSTVKQHIACMCIVVKIILNDELEIKHHDVLLYMFSVSLFFSLIL
jgi:hypothetical protein